MAHLYGVDTNQGSFDVTSPQHHDHMSLADFERLLVQAILNGVSGLSSNLIVHRFTHKGTR